MTIALREMRESDGSAVWSLVRASGTLDVNSAYCYIMLGRWFAATCAVAEQDGRTVGFVSGFRQPQRPDTWFVWQICVDAAVRGQGLAKKLLEHVLGRPGNEDIKYVEATVSPSNAASNALFRRWARERGVRCDVLEGFPSGLFPDGAHEDEPLLRLGPFSK